MRLDTVHLKLDSTLPFMVNPGLMWRNDDELTGANFALVKKGRPSKTEVPHGLGNIRYSETAHACDIEFSSKLLLEQYPEGIHAGTFGRVVEVINSTGAVTVCPLGLAEATVTRADVAINLDLGYDRLPEFFRALKVLDVNTRYRFDASHKTTVNIASRNRKASEKMRIYGKRDELTRAKNREFIRAAGPGVFKRLEGVLRFEREANSFKALRDYVEPENSDKFDGNRVKLWGLLRSGLNPVADMFDAVAIPGNAFQLFDDIEALREAGYSPQQTVSHLGRLHIASRCGTLEELRAAAEKLAPSRSASYRWFATLKPVWAELQAQQSGFTSRASMMAVVEGLRHMLRVAA